MSKKKLRKLVQHLEACLADYDGDSEVQEVIHRRSCSDDPPAASVARQMLKAQIAFTRAAREYTNVDTVLGDRASSTRAKAFNELTLAARFYLAAREVHDQVRDRPRTFHDGRPQ